jgi:hypothetical protein
MLKFQAQVYRINDVVGWNDRRELRLAPEFQRRRVWSPRGKSFLIDSIIRGMPLPQFFIREIVMPREKRTVREVVDGQQRLTTIFEFIAGEFSVLPMHNTAYARLHYEELPENIQKEFLSFPLSVNILEGTEDRDVLEIFSRLNSYSVPLNEQEKLNARYVGAFKKVMLDLAKEHLAFWKRHKILTTQPIARMKDVELTCELVGAMLYGLQNQKKIIATMYKDFDEAFPRAVEVVERLGQTLQMCEELVGGDISVTVYRRTSLFYSLFAAVFDVAYGLGMATRAPRQFVGGDRLLQVREGLIGLSESLSSDDRPDDWEEFYEATRQSTDKLPQREARHRLLRTIIEPAFTL